MAIDSIGSRPPAEPPPERPRVADIARAEAPPERPREADRAEAAPAEPPPPPPPSDQARGRTVDISA